jgi:Peroxidase, family 2
MLHWPFLLLLIRRVWTLHSWVMPNEMPARSMPKEPRVPSIHRGAAPYNSQYPYTGARNGAPGSQVGGVKVPADGDTAHAFEAPGRNDIRGPCPGLNAAANHNVRRPAP